MSYDNDFFMPYTKKKPININVSYGGRDKDSSEEVRQRVREEKDGKKLLRLTSIKSMARRVKKGVLSCCDINKKDLSGLVLF